MIVGSTDRTSTKGPLAFASIDTSAAAVPPIIETHRSKCRIFVVWSIRCHERQCSHKRPTRIVPNYSAFRKENQSARQQARLRTGSHGGKAHATHRMFNPQHPSALTCFLGDISNAKQIDNRVAPKVIGIAGADSHAAGAVIERVSSPGSYFSTSDCRGNRTVLLLAALRFDFDAAAGAAGAGSFIPVS